ncbi:DUF2383 domain-containing protein [Clostridium sp. AL.422]|uniref:DUF2383 domain-containing protein n=1 Tax=Clostridium TaxID=1485 RepID=UPI00293DE968|nr:MULTISPECIES: DUF2383 domain-containing protein [unclassified Clostridium]MDV4150971.1 DUF2383 domain-containing protein [Clostridium sp. AL.422]
MEEKVLKELNSQLEGVIMGENEIIKLLEKAKDYKIIELLDNTLSIAEKNKLSITEEIKRLGGKPTHNEGAWGKIVEVFNSIKEMTIDTDKEILQKAIQGTEMGFKAIIDFLIKEVDLNKDFQKELIDISDEYSDNIKKMQEYLIELN